MGLFNNKNKKEEIRKSFSQMPQLPELPELPKLPELPFLNEDKYMDESIPKLPSFPLNPVDNKFSQNTIKEAVAGKKEDEEVYDADEFPDEEDSEIMRKPLNKPRREDFENYEDNFSIKPKSKEISREFREDRYATKKAEPIFIRIDKFEESMELFEKIKKQISEIEHLVKNTKEIKAKEEEELNSWEMQLQEIKKQVERVNQDIFSKLE